MPFYLRDLEADTESSTSYAADAARTLYPFEAHEGGVGPINSERRLHEVSIFINALVNYVLSSFNDVTVTAPFGNTARFRGSSATLCLDHSDHNVLLLRTARLTPYDGLMELEKGLCRVLRLEPGVLEMTINRAAGDTQSALRIVITQDLLDNVRRSYTAANSEEENVCNEDGQSPRLGDGDAAGCKTQLRPRAVVTLALLGLFLFLVFLAIAFVMG